MAASSDTPIPAAAHPAPSAALDPALPDPVLKVPESVAKPDEPTVRPVTTSATSKLHDAVATRLSTSPPTVDASSVDPNALPLGAAAADLEAALTSVTVLVGPEGAAKFRRAVALTAASHAVDGGPGDEADGDKLSEATRLFVELLTSVDADDSALQRSAGFGELLLWYGKALVGFVRRNGATAGVLGDAAQQGKPQEEDIGEEEEEDDEELAWTQLETARVIFEALIAEESRHGADRYGKRLGDVHATLGELLLEGDEWEAAGREFGIAAGLLVGRLRAEVLYKRYLALRKDRAQDALQSLRESVAAFREVEGADGETLRELSEELDGFSKALLPAMQRVERESATVEVKVVQPRKRARRG